MKIFNNIFDITNTIWLGLWKFGYHLIKMISYKKMCENRWICLCPFFLSQWRWCDQSCAEWYATKKLWRSVRLLANKHFFPLKSPSQCHYNLNFTHNCLIDCLFVFLSFWSDFSLFIHFSSYSFILIHWNLLSKLNINVASKYSPKRWRSCQRYLLYQLVCNFTNVLASNRGAKKTVLDFP